MMTRSTVNSSTISQIPRVIRNLESSGFGFPRSPWKYAPVPARNTKIGAQKWVIHRVKNSAGYVRETSLGSNSVA